MAAPLKRLADEREIAVVAILHTRKLPDDDWTVYDLVKRAKENHVQSPPEPEE